MEPSTGQSAPSIDDVAADPVPPLLPPISPAKPWKEPSEGAHHGLTVPEVLQIASRVDLRKKDSIITHIPFSLRNGLARKDYRKPPNHVMAGKDFPTALTNLAKWGNMSAEEQQLQFNKAAQLSKYQKTRMRRLVSKVNPAEVLPAPDEEEEEQQSQQSAGGNVTTDMEVDGQAGEQSTAAAAPSANAVRPVAVVPHNHIGLMSGPERRARLLEEREEQIHQPPSESWNCRKEGSSAM